MPGTPVASGEPSSGRDQYVSGGGRSGSSAPGARAPGDDGFNAASVERGAVDPRHAADRGLRDRLAETDFAGAEYAQFVRELAAYGIAVCQAWLFTGMMFRECARGGRRWVLHRLTGPLRIVAS